MVSAVVPVLMPHSRVPQPPHSSRHEKPAGLSREAFLLSVPLLSDELSLACKPFWMNVAFHPERCLVQRTVCSLCLCLYFSFSEFALFIGPVCKCGRSLYFFVLFLLLTLVFLCRCSPFLSHFVSLFSVFKSTQYVHSAFVQCRTPTHVLSLSHTPSL